MRRQLLAGLAASLLPAGQAFAAPPYTTDDAGVLPPGVGQVTPYIDSDFRLGQDSGETGVDVTWGVLDRVEFGASLPLGSFDSKDDPFALGDLTLHTKIALMEGSMTAPALAFAPILTIPTNSRGRARPGLDLPMVIGLNRSNWELHASAGYRLQSRADGGGLPFGGIVFEHSLGSRLLLGAECYAQGGGVSGKPLVMFGPGIAWTLSDRVSLVAAGQLILVNRAENGQFHVYAALVLTP